MIIKPCTRCGGEATVEMKTQRWNFWYEVECQNCGHSGMGVGEHGLGYYFRNYEEAQGLAITAWNEAWEEWQVPKMSEEEIDAFWKEQMENLRQIRKELWEQKQLDKQKEQ